MKVILRRLGDGFCEYHMQMSFQAIVPRSLQEFLGRKVQQCHHITAWIAVMSKTQVLVAEK
jgi:hypothetical protein